MFHLSQSHYNISWSDMACTPTGELRSRPRRVGSKLSLSERRAIEEEYLRRLLGEGLRVREIAVAMGCTERTVYNRLNRLRAQDAAAQLAAREDD